jgi:hypothetical protein
LIKAHHTPDINERGRLYILGALFSAGAAVAKQAGVYMALCYPVLVAADVIFSKIEVDRRHIRNWLTAFALISIIWVSWYALKEVRILTGMDYANIDTLVNLSTQKFDQQNLFQQIAAALGQHPEFVILFILIAVVFPWMDRFYQVLTLLFAPYPLIWAWMASYDTRNLSVFLPVLAVVAGYAIDRILIKLTRLGEGSKAMQIPIGVPLALGCIAVLSLNAVVTPERLQQRQMDLQKQIFSPNKNQMLYDLVAANGPQTRILTNYPMNFIPGLSGYQSRFDFDDYDVFLARVQDPAVEYMLVPNAIDDRIKDYINARIDAGDYEVISRDKQWKVFTLIRILNRE